MKKLKYLIPATLLSCVTVDYDKMNCYKTSSCLDDEDLPVTERVIAVKYSSDENGFPKEVLIEDKWTHQKYRLMRKDDSTKILKLERVIEKINCPYYLNCDWDGPTK